MINVCAVVFNRYDLLRGMLLDSLKKSLVPPTNIFIIDRGGEINTILTEHEAAPVTIVPMGGNSLAEAWNWFAKNVPEERIITNDDIRFAPEALGVMAGTPGDFLGLADGVSSHFACFMLRDSCIQKIGYFDESLSPDYLYFEDVDYLHRMTLAGIPVTGIKCIEHAISQTMKLKTPMQIQEHHVRFSIAMANYITKWGGPPDEETCIR